MRSSFFSFAIIVLSLACVESTAHAQPWSGILDPSRAIDWSTAGVVGGIPTNRDTICATFNPGATAAEISAQLGNAACANKVVKLNAGTYNLTAGLDFQGNSNVTLRGAGPDKTLLKFTAKASCLGQGATICIRGRDLGYYGADSGPAHIANWTSGYAKGSAQITLSSTTGLSVGMFIFIDQLNDTTDTGNIYVCGTAGVCVQQGSTPNGRTGRGQRQLVRVTGINGTIVTISPGVYMPNYRAAQSPSAWWGNVGSLVSGNGIEDLSIDGTNASGGQSNVTLIFAVNSWVKNIRSINASSPRAHLLMYETAQCTVRDSYFVGSRGDADSSTNYGIESSGSSDALVENNIIQHRTTPLISDGDQGSVWAYNFSIDDHYTANGTAPTFMQASSYSHEIGNGMVLREGNIDVGEKGDVIHGTSNLFTYFRNQSIGWETGKDGETSPVILHANQRYWAFIGNVLGKSGYHNTYQADSQTAIWRIGISYGGIPADPLVAQTLMRWGNYDTVSGAVRWEATEVPSGISAYPNAIPTSHTLPASFYLTAEPSWWGLVPWPAIGPDVSGGDVANVGGHVYKIPAQLCWEGVALDPAYSGDPAAVKVFTPATCYTPTAIPLAPPQNLRIIQ
jgi:hypothetical protein